MKPVAVPIPDAVRGLLWDVDLQAFDPRGYPDYCLERVLELGGPDAFRWAVGVFSRESVRSFVKTTGPRRLSPRALNFWALVLDIEDRECLLKSSLENRERLWTYWPVRA